MRLTVMRNGSTEDAYFTYSLLPVFDTDGAVAGILNPVLETTAEVLAARESARARSALRLERDQSNYIFDSMVEGFALLDRDWRILRMNAEGLRLTQQTAERVLGRSHWELWPELLGGEVERLYRQVMDQRKAGIIDIPYDLPAGMIWMEVRVHPALEGGVALFFRDVSKRKHSEEQLREADRRKDEFLAMLAHELRNPLAPISAAADLLQVGRIDEARVRQTSQIIGRQVRHMTGLVDDLLDVSRVTRGLVELHIETLDLHRVVTDAVEQVTPLIRARRHHLALELAPETPLVDGDRKRLVQVFANLLNNAAKFTAEGGHIGIRTEVRDSQVLFHVTDDGIGMTPELATRAFDLFTQAERSPDRSLGGLGLGLALVKSLVGLHGGTAASASPGLGRGSSFTVCLPRRLVREQPGAAAAATSNQQDGGGPLRIMVVDDNVDAASILAMLLEGSGHEVLVEHGAREALARSKSAGVRVFLLDIGLPGMDGKELARHLRAQAGTADAVLVAVTGYGQESDREQTRAAGFDHHLVKPVDMDSLYAILAKPAIPQAEEIRLFSCTTTTRGFHETRNWHRRHLLPRARPGRAARLVQAPPGHRRAGVGRRRLHLDRRAGQPTGGTTVWSIGAADSNHFAPGTANFMINYRVADLAGLLRALRDEGCQVLEKTDVDSEFGKFGWVIDPEGNKVELWEPPAGQ
jgi:PAS domain S-box-containing protein